LHESHLLGHLLILIQPVVPPICPKAQPVHLTTPSREGVQPELPRHMSTKLRLFRSTAPHHSLSARVRLRVLRPSTFQARTSWRIITMLQTLLQIPMAIRRAPSPRPSRSCRYRRHSRQRVLDLRPHIIKLMTRCFTRTELRTIMLITTISTTTREVPRRFVPLIMAWAAGSHMEGLMVAVQDIPLPITHRLLGQA
jgi:hypothetical protein